jgi:lysophospholipase L1-like esterase
MATQRNLTRRARAQRVKKFLLLSGLVVLLLACRTATAQTPYVLTFAGDSIMAGYGATAEPYTVLGRLNSMQPSWFIRNYSVGGASVSSRTVPWPWPGVDPNAVNALLGDPTVVFLGTNDWAYSDPLTTFTTDYTNFINTAAYFGSTVVCVTPIWRSTAEGTMNDVGLTLDDYRAAIAQVCSTLGHPVIDGLTLVPHKAAYFVDGLHPNNAGYYYYAQNLSAALSPFVK